MSGNCKIICFLENEIFPDVFIEYAEKDKALSVLLAIAPLAKNEKGLTLFPARMHMLFRGIKGVLACTNPNCPDRLKDVNVTLGKVSLSAFGKPLVKHVVLLFTSYTMIDDVELCS